MIHYRHYCVVILVAITLYVTGCSRNEPVKIGFLGGLSGRSADLGIDGLNGVNLAIEKANRSGGIKGSPIELLVMDDEQNPELAVSHVESLLKSGVRIIIGPMTSSIAARVIPPSSSSGAVFLSPTVTSSDFTGKDDNFLRVCSDVNEYAEKNARYLYEKLGHRKVSIIYDVVNSSYSERRQAAFRETFEKYGGKVVSTFRFASGKDTVFLASARQMLASGPDLVLIVANPVDASSISQQLRKLKRDVVISLAEWASSERFIELTGSYAEGIYVSQFLNRNDTSNSYLDFHAEYKQRYGLEPGFSAVAGYDAAMIAITALTRQVASPRNAKETIVSIGRFQGLQGPITIDRFGDSQRSTFLSVIRNGKYQTLE